MKERIKKIRKALDLTQQEFADKIGIKRNSYANYETGRNTPIDAIILSICREFNVNESWLRTGEGEMFNPPSTNALDQLACKYHLSNADYIMIEKFVNLKAETRHAIFDYFQEVVNAISDDEIYPSTNASLESSALALSDSTPEEKSKQYGPLEMPEGSMPDLLRRINSHKTKDA